MSQKKEDNNLRTHFEKYQNDNPGIKISFASYKQKVNKADRSGLDKYRKEINKPFSQAKQEWFKLSDNKKCSYIDKRLGILPPYCDNFVKNKPKTQIKTKKQPKEKKGSRYTELELADIAAFRKFKRINKIISELEAENTWNKLSDKEKCKYMDKRRKTKPSFCVETAFIEDLLDEEIIIEEPKVSTNIENAYKVEYIEAIDYLYKEFGNVGYDGEVKIEFFNRYVEFFDTIEDGIEQTNNVSLNYWIRNVIINDDEVTYSDPINEEFISKRRDFRKQLFSKDNLNEYQDKIIRTLNNRIKKLQDDIQFWSEQVREVRESIENKTNYVDYKNKTYKFSIKRYENLINKYENKILNKRADIRSINEQIFDIIDNFSEIIKDKDNLPQVTLSSHNQAIFGAYLMYLNGLTGNREILIVDIKDENYYISEAQSVLFNPMTVDKTYIPVNTETPYYGYFMYEWPDKIQEEAETHKFNSYLASPCAISCLLYNPEFVKLCSIYRAGFYKISSLYEENEEYYKYCINKACADISYHSNCYSTDQYFKLNKIKDIHNKIAKLMNIEFSVTYYKHSKNRMRTIRYKYPLDDGKKVITEKELLENHFNVVLSDSHCFNVNSEEALTFLRKNVLGQNKDNWVVFDLNEDYNEGKIVYDYHFKKAKSNKDEYYSKINTYFNNSPEDEIIKSGIKQFIPKNQQHKITGNDKTKSYEKILYVSMDIETNPKVIDKTEYHVPYSMSSLLFNKNVIFKEKYFTYNIESLSTVQIMEHFEYVSKFCNDNGYGKVYCFFHYGGKFDMKVLEKYILKYEGLQYASPKKDILIEGINTSYGLIHLKFQLKSSKTTFIIRDSYRLLDCAAADLCKTYNLSEQSIKYDYPYALYKKLNKDSPKSFSKQKMIDFMDYEELSKNKTVGNKKKLVKVIKYYKDFNNIDELEQFKKFVEQYFEKNETFVCEDYCREYNDQDVKIVAEALIAANKLYEQLGKECNIKCLDPDMHGIIEREQNLREKKKSKNCDKVTDRVLSHICILHEMTLPSFIGKILKKEGIYDNNEKVSYPCTSDNGLLDYFNNILQGGICYTAKNISKRLFYSKYMEKIATHPAFYIKPRYNKNGSNHKSYQELLDVYSKFGYDSTKQQPKFDQKSLNEIKSMMKVLFSEEGVSTIVSDANSLYPSSISKYYLADGKYSNMTQEEYDNFDFNNYKYPFIGEFKYELGQCKSIIPFITSCNDKGEYINISDQDKGEVILDHIKVTQFKRLYKDGKLTFVRGIKAEGFNKNFAEFVNKLYPERQKFKDLANSDDINLRNKSKIENTIKLLLNSSYGKMIQKEIHDNQVYLSKEKFDEYDTYYSRYIKQNSESILKNVIIENSEVVSNIISSRKQTRSHKNKADWGSTILSGSKLLMQQFIEMIGQENVLYMDTDCCHCDASFALKEDVNKLLFESEGKENTKLCGFKSDFDNKFWDETKLKPINQNIGLSSILNNFCGKKMYVNHILGWHQDGYMTVSMKKRFKGVSGYNIHTIDFLKMLYSGEKYVQNINEFSKFKVKSQRGHGLINLKDQLKVVKAEFQLKNPDEYQKRLSEILLK